MHINTTLIINLLSAIASALLPGDTFTRLKAAVDRWDDKIDLDGPDKAKGVAHELESWGIHMAQWAANLLIELAVSKLRLEQGRDPMDVG